MVLLEALAEFDPTGVKGGARQPTTAAATGYQNGSVILGTFNELEGGVTPATYEPAGPGVPGSKQAAAGRGGAPRANYSDAAIYAGGDCRKATPGTGSRGRAASVYDGFEASATVSSTDL